MNLNRRDRVETLKQHGQYEIQKSYNELERSSPIRRPAGTNQFRWSYWI